ncbi:MAG TPA: Flp pilus assembly protein CpaB [Bryobacteraceae bacterium]|nr:Flp pilus assembly protein CpaB [Bryobacteraceae bacterium]
MKKNLVPLLGVAFVVAIASTGIFYGLFVNKLRSPGGSQKTLVIAARELNRGAVLTAGDVKTAPWPGQTLPKGTFSRPDAAVGTTVIEAIGEGEPVLQERLVSKDGNTQNGLGIPLGLRAVSIHVIDSTGVLSRVRPGYKVDVQVVSARNGSPADTEVRTVLEDVTVLHVGPAETSAKGFSAPVLTVLAHPADADVLAVADSAARIRVALRNPLDDETHHLPGLSLATVFHEHSGGPARSEQVMANNSVTRSGVALVAAARTDTRPFANSDEIVSLRVGVVAVDPGGLDEIGAQLISPGQFDLLQVSPLRPGADPEISIRHLQDRHLIELVSTSKVTAGLNRTVSVQAGTHPVEASVLKGARAKKDDSDSDCGIRIRFSPFLTATGKLRLRVSPEIVTPEGGNISVRKMETETDLRDGQSFLVTGLTNAQDRAALLNRLFAGHEHSPASGMELLVLVTPQIIKPLRAAVLRK